MKRILCFCTVLALFLTGCKLGPNYSRPPIHSPEAWKEPVQMDSTLANVQWWEVFQDPQLQDLIRIALEENKDLKIAVERIEEARAFYGFQRADLYPQVDANASASHQEISRESIPQLPEGVDRTTPLYTLGASVFWELDFFGRIRRATEAERAILLSTEEARRFAVITLVSDVAVAYMELRDLDLRLEISRRTLLSREEYVKLARLRFEGGLTSELDWRQAEAEYFRTEAIVKDFENFVAQKENEISVLLGRNPGHIIRGRSLEEQPVPPQVPSGLPSELLERRPDIAQAEQLLVSSNARIGEAKALLYPRISLTGFFGWESTDLGDVVSGPARTWNIAGNLLQPIFNAGKNQRRVEVTESQYRQTLYAYESTIIQAFREVEDSLVDYQKSGERRVSQASRVEAERRVLTLAEVRYRGGVSDYLEVLDAQRSLFDAELDSVISIRNQLVALVRLYKALGGGWTEPAPTNTPEQQPQTTTTQSTSSNK
ncbi:MAG TPA: efflux transporter outer membrane subunit [Acidobacteriota bacterium]|nr:efflux transporter outer membrane subunit [Acidobacteriota bacterium]